MGENIRKTQPKVQNGLDVLLNKEVASLKGRPLGLLAHSASITSGLQYAWEALASLPGIRIKSLFSPEHGLMGTHQDMEGVVLEASSLFQGVPVYSLYGTSPDSLKPSAGMLEGVDVLLVDLQDVGSRYYTYLYTLTYCMEVCRDMGIEVWVLDRPNPLGGLILEGNLLSPGVSLFCGEVPVDCPSRNDPGRVCRDDQRRL